MTDVERLLDLQDLDTAADQLRHRRDHLPEREALAAHQAALAALEAEAEPLRQRRHEIERVQKAAEDEIALLEEKIAKVNAALYGGSTDVKELQSLQQELDALGRRKASLEDRVLEQMVEAEPLDAELAAIAARREAIDADAVAATAALAEAEAAIDAELAGIAERRAALVEGIDAGLLQRYEQLRARLRGVGIARFTGGTCQGCHLTLPAAEAEQVRKEARDRGLATCPECDRLLVVS